MATQPSEPIYITTKGYGTETVSRSPASAWQVALGLIDEPTIIDIPRGIRQVAIQGRMCGDYYAEVSGGIICKSAFAATPHEALSCAVAKIGGAA